MIVNRVTSINPGIDTDSIDVGGSRANAILVNPNGVTLNGSSFLNTGRVERTTGRVGFKDTVPAVGIPWRNIAPDIATGTTILER